MVGKMKKSLLDIEDRFDELPADLQEIARSLCWTLQVNGPVIDKRGNDYYFLFSYYDGDPEYYFDELNIQQNSAEQYNYLNLSEIARNPPEWMSKSTKKMNKAIIEEGAEFDTPKGIMRINRIQRTYDDYGNCLSWWLSCEYVDEPDGWGKYIDYSDSKLLDMLERGEISRIQKKSAPSIHDMIAQVRENNNSLAKSRVDLGISKVSGYTPSQMLGFAQHSGTLGNRYESVFDVVGQVEDVINDMYDALYDGGEANLADDLSDVKRSYLYEWDFKGVVDIVNGIASESNNPEIQRYADEVARLLQNLI